MGGLDPRCVVLTLAVGPDSWADKGVNTMPDYDLWGAREHITRRVPSVETKYAIPTGTLLSVFVAIASEAEKVEHFERLFSHETIQNVSCLLNELDIAKITDDFRLVQLKKAPRVRYYWRKCDRMALYWQLSAWVPLRRVARFGNQVKHRYDFEVYSSVERLAHNLGASAKIFSSVYPGAACPSVDEIRNALNAKMDTLRDRQWLPMHELLITVFLKKLKVSPFRVVLNWKQLVEAGCFRGMDFLQGEWAEDVNSNKQRVMFPGTDGWGFDFLTMRMVHGFSYIRRL